MPETSSAWLVHDLSGIWRDGGALPEFLVSLRGRWVRTGGGRFLYPSKKITR